MLEWVRYYHLCLWMITWCVASLECKMHFSTVDSLFHSASIVCFFARETAHMLLSICTVWDQLGKPVLQMSIHSSAVLTHVVVAKQCAVVMVNLAWLWFSGCTNASLCCRRRVWFAAASSLQICLGSGSSLRAAAGSSNAFSSSLCSQISPGRLPYGWPRCPRRGRGSRKRLSLFLQRPNWTLLCAMPSSHSGRRYFSTTGKSSAFNIQGFRFRNFLSRFFCLRQRVHYTLTLSWLIYPFHSNTPFGHESIPLQTMVPDRI